MRSLVIRKKSLVEELKFFYGVGIDAFMRVRGCGVVGMGPTHVTEYPSCSGTQVESPHIKDVLC